MHVPHRPVWLLVSLATAVVLEFLVKYPTVAAHAVVPVHHGRVHHGAK